MQDETIKTKKRTATFRGLQIVRARACCCCCCCCCCGGHETGSSLRLGLELTPFWNRRWKRRASYHRRVFSSGKSVWFTRRFRDGERFQILSIFLYLEWSHFWMFATISVVHPVVWPIGLVSYNAMVLEGKCNWTAITANRCFSCTYLVQKPQQNKHVCRARMQPKTAKLGINRTQQAQARTAQVLKRALWNREQTNAGQKQEHQRSSLKSKMIL